MSYVRIDRRTANAMGFSLKPPKWLRNVLKAPATFIAHNPKPIIAAGALASAAFIPGAGALLMRGGKFAFRGASRVAPFLPATNTPASPVAVPPLPGSSPLNPVPVAASSSPYSPTPIPGGGGGGFAPIDQPVAAATPVAAAGSGGFPIVPVLIGAAVLFFGRRMSRRKVA